MRRRRGKRPLIRIPFAVVPQLLSILGPGYATGWTVMATWLCGIVLCVMESPISMGIVRRWPAARTDSGAVRGAVPLGHMPPRAPGVGRALAGARGRSDASAGGPVP